MHGAIPPSTETDDLAGQLDTLTVATAQPTGKFKAAYGVVHFRLAYGVDHQGKKVLGVKSTKLLKWYRTEAGQKVGAKNFANRYKGALDRILMVVR